MPRGVKFILSPQIFLRDPQETEFGQRILHHGVEMIYDLGIEKFTFRKLAEGMGSAEASIYRYFDSKHSLLLYLTAWYWEWVHYVIDYNTRNIEDPVQCLRRALHSLIFAAQESDLTSYINENLLHQVIIREGTKSYHHQEVNEENQKGVYSSYKELIEKLASFTRAVRPCYEHHLTLSSALFEMTLSQLYFAEHLPRVTDIPDDDSKYLILEDYLFHLASSTLELA